MSKYHYVLAVACLFECTLSSPEFASAQNLGSRENPGVPASPIPGPSGGADAVQADAKLSLVSLGAVKRSGNRTFLVLDKKYAPGLVSIADFSHIMVFYWCDRNDTPDKRAFLQGYRRGKENPLTGVFATRSPVRPNPIAITTCKIVQVKDNVVEIEWIDAFDDSPIIDLKPYIPRNDSIPSAKIPVWVQ